MTALEEYLASLYEPWEADAECRGMDPDLFFPGPGDDHRPALAVCASCPVIVPCRELAMSMPENLSGVWGGTTWRDRTRIRRQQDRERRRRG